MRGKETDFENILMGKNNGSTLQNVKEMLQMFDMMINRVWIGDNILMEEVDVFFECDSLFFAEFFDLLIGCIIKKEKSVGFYLDTLLSKMVGNN